MSMIPNSVIEHVRSQLELVDRNRIRIVFSYIYFYSSSYTNPYTNPYTEEIVTIIGEMEILRIPDIKSKEIQLMAMGEGLFRSLGIMKQEQRNTSGKDYVILFHYNSIPSFYSLLSRDRVLELLRVMPLPADPIMEDRKGWILDRVELCFMIYVDLQPKPIDIIDVNIDIGSSG